MRQYHRLNFLNQFEVASWVALVKAFKTDPLADQQRAVLIIIQDWLNGNTDYSSPLFLSLQSLFFCFSSSTGIFSLEQHHKQWGSIEELPTFLQDFLLGSNLLSRQNQFFKKMAHDSNLTIVNNSAAGFSNFDHFNAKETHCNSNQRSSSWRTYFGINRDATTSNSCKCTTTSIDKSVKRPLLLYQNYLMRQIRITTAKKFCFVIWSHAFFILKRKVFSQKFEAFQHRSRRKSQRF
jgi:hypothetical protein